MPNKTDRKSENMKILSAFILLVYLLLKLICLLFTPQFMRWPLRLLFLAFAILHILSVKETKRSAVSFRK